MTSQNSLTIPWHGSNGQNSLTYFGTSPDFSLTWKKFSFSLTFPWHVATLIKDFCFSSSFKYNFQILKVVSKVILQTVHSMMMKEFEVFKFFFFLHFSFIEAVCSGVPSVITWNLFSVNYFTPLPLSSIRSSLSFLQIRLSVGVWKEFYTRPLLLALRGYNEWVKEGYKI